VSETHMKKNWDRTAMRFVSARYVHRQEMLDVTFENGDRFILAAESVLSGVNRAAFLTPPDWPNLRIGVTKDVLEVPAWDTVVEIPWDRIRSVADPEFRAHLADKARERAHRLGARIRAMRLEAGLTPVALAAKIRVSRETVADLEAGKIEPQADLIEEIAIALGRRHRDFSDD
jgi:DNA-binding XRE family transcriptional regulator